MNPETETAIPTPTPIPTPIPILLAITELDPGGAERALVALATGLDPERWRVRVVSLGDRGAMAEPLDRAGVPTLALGCRSAREFPRAARELAAILRDDPPRIAQGFLFHANIVARVAARLAFREAPERRPIVLAGVRVAEPRPWHNRLDRLTRAWCDGWVCVSEGVRRHVARALALPLDDPRLHVIPNSVDPARFDVPPANLRQELGCPPDGPEFVVAFVGRLAPQKGWPELLDAWKSTPRVMRLAIVGDGPDRDDLARRVADDPDLRARVRWLGRRDDVPALLRAADALVLPSRWEGMPNVALEAMAAGLPVVATEVEGIPELVVPGETGWIVPPRDPRALAEALRELESDRRRAERLGAAGRARVERRFSPAAMVAAYERLWLDRLHPGRSCQFFIPRDRQEPTS